MRSGLSANVYSGKAVMMKLECFIFFHPEKMLAVASIAGSLLFQGGFSRSLHFVPVTLAIRLPRGSLCGEQGPAGNVGRTRASPRVRLHFVSGQYAPALSLAEGTI